MSGEQNNNKLGLQPGSLKTITDSKLVTFAVGQQKKTRFQKQREEKELKRKQDEEEAAKVYDSFVASFKEEEDTKTFVRGGRVQGGRNFSDDQPGDLYKLDSRKSKTAEADKLLEELKDRDKERAARQSSSSSSKTNSGKKERQIDHFLHEIKSKHEKMDNQQYDDELEGGSGSHDTGDPNTTNLYVNNLALTTTEDRVREAFEKFGKVISVKIMWPRTEEERSRSLVRGHCGFVSFKHRDDAEDALIELHDSEIDGHRVAVGWGKAFKTNPVPVNPVQPLVFQPPHLVSPGLLPPGVIPMGLPPHVRFPPPPGMAPGLPPPGMPPFIPGGPRFPLPPGMAPGMGLPPPPGGFIPRPPPAFAPAPLVSEVKKEEGEKKEDPKQLSEFMTNLLSESTTETSAPSIKKKPSRFDKKPADMTASGIKSLLNSIAANANAQIPPIQNTVPVASGGDAFPPSPNTGLPPPTFRPPPSGPPPTYPPTGFPGMARFPPPPGMPPFVRVSGGDSVAPKVPVVVPADARVRALIDLCARFVSAADGERFEQNIRIKEAQNPDFQFLFNPDSLEANYYRFRIYANKEGISEQSWAEQGFLLRPPPAVLPPPIENANKVQEQRRGQSDHEEDRRSRRKRSRSRSPSPGSRRRRERESREESIRKKYKGMTGAQIERAKAKEKMEKESQLSSEDLGDWLVLLKTLNLSRESIKKTMGFVFDHVESAEQMVLLAKEKLITANTPAAVKISGLFLFSDLLHNSAAPVKYASNLRTIIQNVLPEVINNLSIALRSASGRMSANNIEDRLKKIFTTWENWSIFPAPFLNGLKAMFYFTESENYLLQQYIQQNKNKLEEIGNNMEQEKKKAKMLGIYFSENSSILEILYKIQYVERYFQQLTDPDRINNPSDAFRSAILGLSTGNSNGSILPLSTYTEDDELDGAPLEIDELDGVAWNGNPPSPDNIDGDPIDGQPLLNTEKSVGSWQVLDNTDDIDGAPMENDELDGVPFDDELDGVPLDNPSPQDTSPRGEKDKKSSSSHQDRWGSADDESDDDDWRGAGGGHKEECALQEALLSLRDVLEASGKTEEEIEQILTEMKAQQR